MIDKRPLAIARCADADDVATALRFAAQHALPIAVRGGGHNVAGTAVVDDGLVIDLAAMRGVRIDPSGRTVHLQGGATWADVDRVTAPLGLAAPGGVVPDRRRGPGAERRRLAPAPPRRDDRRQPRLGRGRPRRRPPRAGERRRARGPVLGAARRRRQLRRRHVLPAAPARARPAGVRAQRRLPDRGRRARARGLARRGRRRTRPTLSTAGLIWSLPDVDELPEQLRGVPYVGVAGMWPATRRGRARHPGPARAGRPAARHERIRPLPRLPALPGPVLPGRRAPLLEGALPRRLLRRRDRHHRRLVQPPPVERHAGHRPPLRRRDGARRRRADRVRRPQPRNGC